MRIHVEALCRVSSLITVVLVLPALAATISGDEAIIERTGNHVMVSSDAPRPLHAVATVLNREFGWSISVEDPLWSFDGDLHDASLDNARLRTGTLVPRGGHLQVEFKVTDDAAGVMMALLEAANQQLPFVYRLDKDGDNFRLVPVRVRNDEGRLSDAVPLLDRLVSIPYGTRPINEVASLMADVLSRQTGLQVTCCQSVLGGLPWGLSKITYEANQVRARDVLKHLMEQEGGPGRWMSRCDRRFCFIDFR
jgi:hypothetical protein